jgi:DNA invertase Pin-like site-specific DNA recombinase
MIGFIYCRSAPNDMRVARSDRTTAQKQRCWDFACEHGLTVVRRYADQGDVHPVYLAPSLSNMLRMIEHEKKRVVVLVDHPNRLGKTPQIVRQVIKEIEQRRALFLPTSTYNKSYLAKFYQEKRRRGMR